MVRIDTQSVVVLGFALMASFGTALTIRHLEGDGRAQAATPVVEAAIGASGTDAQVVKGADGHYWTEANIDGKAVRVLVDTGASVVALTRADALRLGVDPEPEAFTGKVQTASGVVGAAAGELTTLDGGGARGG
ncbi:MAG: TIGR02281 family clan AA aspartic protease, partial [Pseudomonadota bacterium]|nr:TIGR02281 family clan AA aspartic protease [Pseudomonadota bacterium]